MKILYVGFTPAIRTVDDARWDAANGYAAEVDSPALVANLLTNRPLQGRDGEQPCDFAVADDDPIKALGASDTQIAGLALAGVITRETLAVQDPSRLASESGINAKALAALIAKAK